MGRGNVPAAAWESAAGDGGGSCETRLLDALVVEMAKGVLDIDKGSARRVWGALAVGFGESRCGAIPSSAGMIPVTTPFGDRALVAN